MIKLWYVYVIQSKQRRFVKGKWRPGFYYVGSTTNPSRRIRQHNGEIKGGAKFTSKHMPWEARALYGPYRDRSDACKAERALKKGKRGSSRCKWASSDSQWYRGLGTGHPWVQDVFWYKKRDDLMKKAGDKEKASWDLNAQEALNKGGDVELSVSEEGVYLFKLL